MYTYDKNKKKYSTRRNESTKLGTNEAGKHWKATKNMVDKVRKET